MKYSVLPKEFGEGKKKAPEDGGASYKNAKKMSNMIALALAVALTLLYAVYGMTSISLHDDGTELVISCTGGSAITVRHSDITSVEYAQELALGECLSNESKYGRFYCGLYAEDALGQYRLCAYKSFDEYIILTVNAEKIVFNMGGQEATQAAYQALLDECAQERGAN